MSHDEGEYFSCIDDGSGGEFDLAFLDSGTANQSGRHLFERTWACIALSGNNLGGVNGMGIGGSNEVRGIGGESNVKEHMRSLPWDSMSAGDISRP